MCLVACSCPFSFFLKRVEQTLVACVFLRREREKGELERRLNNCRHGWSRGMESVGRNQQKEEKSREEGGEIERRRKDILSNFPQIYLDL
jgi:hypothetical protein